MRSLPPEYRPYVRRVLLLMVLAAALGVALAHLQRDVRERLDSARVDHPHAACRERAHGRNALVPNRDALTGRAIR